MLVCCCLLCLLVLCLNVLLPHSVCLLVCIVYKCCVAGLRLSAFCVYCLLCVFVVFVVFVLRVVLAGVLLLYLLC